MAHEIRGDFRHVPSLVGVLGGPIPEWIDAPKLGT